MTHHLIVPLIGDLELVHTEATAAQILETYEVGSAVTLTFEVDNQPGGTVTFIPGDNPDRHNRRARDVLVWLCGAHVQFTGTVIFTDVAPDLIAELVKDIG